LTLEELGWRRRREVVSLNGTPPTCPEPLGSM
jgi:hypothetical protein